MSCEHCNTELIFGAPGMDGHYGHMCPAFGQYMVTSMYTEEECQEMQRWNADHNRRVIRRSAVDEYWLIAFCGFLVAWFIWA